MTSRQMKAQERKAQTERMAKVREAVSDEMSRFNAKVAAGARPVLQTAFGPYEVRCVTAEWDYVTFPAGESRNSWNQRTFCGCNNGSWEDLLRQVGESRNPLFG